MSCKYYVIMDFEKWTQKCDNFIDGHKYYLNEDFMLVDSIGYKWGFGNTKSIYGLKIHEEGVAEGTNSSIESKEVETIDNNATNHDEHYKQEIEPIDFIEQVLKNIGDQVEASVLYNIGNAIKYLGRLGKKDDIEKELDKVENYIHRARTGKWR